jgi:putative transposase
MSTAVFRDWRAKSGGMDASLMARRKMPEEDDKRLKKKYVKVRQKAEIIAEAITKIWGARSQRREMPLELNLRIKPRKHVG